jgi:hypothetical protein
MNRIQNKVKDVASQESFSKLSSLIDYYNKPVEASKDNIEWKYWEENIRSSGLVDNIKSKYDEYKTYNYNIDSVAQRSSLNSEVFDQYVGCFNNRDYSSNGIIIYGCNNIWIILTH